MVMKRIPKAVWILGLVSFFNDIAAEMVYPIVPIFLTTVLNAPVSIVGLIEGIAEGTASIGKFIFGYFSDKIAKRKIFVVGGYGFSSLSKLLMGLSFSWPFVLFARFIDRLGKGVRTGARDSILMQNTNPKNKGFIFGFHRAFDSAGAVLGPILALLLLNIMHENLRTIFLIAFIPSAIGVILLILFIKEKGTIVESQKFHFNLKWKGLNPSFKLFFIISIIFSLGNSSDAFLILRTKDLGFSATLAVFSYMLYNLSQTIFATPAGKFADKIGSRRVFAGGLLVFALVYFLFGIVRNPMWFWLIFPLYGVYIAATDGVSKAYISEFISQKESGTYFGLYQTGLAVASFFASLIAGIIWSRIGPAPVFYFGSFMSIAALSVLAYGKFLRKI